MKQSLRLLANLAVLAVGMGRAHAVERFPPPDLGADYQAPHALQMLPHGAWMEWLDAGLLVAAIVTASYLVLRTRSRRGVLVLGLVSMAYFGFFREGCICSIGSIQNVAMALGGNGYALPVGAAVFFLIPLLGTLLWGRTFCAAVCPHGALQDAVTIRPLAVPPWLEHGLRMLRHVYLVLALLFAANGAAFIICRYDPFVAIFRLSG